MKRFIGIYSSIPGSGKTEIAKILQEHGFSKLSFAQPLKKITKNLLVQFGINSDEAHYYINVKKEIQIPGLPYGITARYIMQRLGTDFCRNMIDEDFWIKCFINQLNFSSGPVVVDDMRFKNEAKIIKNFGGSLWKVIRPQNNMNKQIAHESEGQLDDLSFDAIIENNGTIEELRQKVIKTFLL